MYIVFDLMENEYEFVDTEKEAIEKANFFLRSYQDNAATDGWPEDIVGSIGYAEVKAQSKVTKIEKKSDTDEDEWEYDYDYDEIWYVDIVQNEEKDKEPTDET